MNKVDWSKPIEAVHEDGRVVIAILDNKNYDDNGVKIGADDYFWSYENGDVPSTPWTIRNVADTDTVTVKRMTREEARAAGDAIEKIDSKYCFAYVAEKLFRDAGLIKPDPTPADRFKADNPQWALRDRGDLIDDVLAWVKENG